MIFCYRRYGITWWRPELSILGSSSSVKAWKSFSIWTVSPVKTNAINELMCPGLHETAAAYFERAILMR